MGQKWDMRNWRWQKHHLTVAVFVSILLGSLMVGARAAAPVTNQTAAMTQAANTNPITHSAAFSRDGGTTSTKVLDNVAQSSWLKTVEMERGHLSLVEGRSHLLRFERRISRISVSEPAVLDFVILSPNEVLLNARKEGSLNIILWDYENSVSVFDINVTKDPSILLALLHQIDPKGNFEIYPSKDVFVIKGEVGSEKQAKEIAEAANAFAEGSVSLVHVKEAKQILLKIRFIQVDLSQNFDFGLDLEVDASGRDGTVLQRFLPGNTTAASAGTTGADATSSLTGDVETLAFDIFDRNDSDLYQIFLSQGSRKFLGFIKALESKGVTKTIARPNLLATDGVEATFVVGGEAPVVVSNDNQSSVEYRELGTRLTYKADIIGSNKIRLQVEPEVSAIDASLAVSTATIQAPGFSTTKVSTTVELNAGETFMIGGLIQQTETETDTGVPGLRRLPFIGKLFQDTNHDWKETELLIMVTPIIVEPRREDLSDDPATPTTFSTATGMSPFRVPDERSDAMREYIQRYYNFMTGQQLEQDSSADVGAIEINASEDLKALENMEKLLEWEEAKEVTGVTDTTEEIAPEEEQRGQAG
ncbi:MAG: pilus assembly protein N-terminal domain-containing protein [Candidatus Omnitrophota bacterium]|nr:pilus assembly protein N-terminal domain-containing protein [Candidatus Omnitrophota bacterium]